MNPKPCSPPTRPATASTASTPPRDGSQDRLIDDSDRESRNEQPPTSCLAEYLTQTKEESLRPPTLDHPCPNPGLWYLHRRMTQNDWSIRTLRICILYTAQCIPISPIALISARSKSRYFHWGGNELKDANRSIRAQQVGVSWGGHGEQLVSLW